MEQNKTIKLPAIVNILPLVGAGIGVAICYYKLEKKTAMPLISLGVLGFAVGSLPKAIMLDKIKKESELKAIYDEANKKALNPDKSKNSWDILSDDAKETSTEQIVNKLDDICKHSGSYDAYKNKRQYFSDLIDSFQQDERDAMYNLLIMIENYEDSGQEDELLKQSTMLDRLEREYGKETIDRVNSKLNAIVKSVQEDSLTPAI